MFEVGSTVGSTIQPRPFSYPISVASSSVKVAPVQSVDRHETMQVFDSVQPNLNFTSQVQPNVFDSVHSNASQSFVSNLSSIPAGSTISVHIPSSFLGSSMGQVPAIPNVALGQVPSIPSGVTGQTPSGLSGMVVAISVCSSVEFVRWYHAGDN